MFSVRQNNYTFLAFFGLDIVIQCGRSDENTPQGIMDLNSSLSVHELHRKD